MRRWCALAIVALLAASGCAAPYDDDGETVVALAPVAAPRPDPDATPVVVDTDLGGDDLAALTFLLQHPSVDVRAVTVAATGLVGCEAGVDVVTGLFAALRQAPTPIACGRDSAGSTGRRFPASWRELAESGTGIPPVTGVRVPRAADELIGDLARSTRGLVVVALGPLTNVADLAYAHPGTYSRLARVHAMGGSVAGPLVDGVAEWNAAADPESFAAVLAGPVPVTLVPEDAVPDGTPEALDGPAVSPVLSRVAAAVEYPAWWDLAAAAALVVPRPGSAEPGGWVLDDPRSGRLRREGAGDVTVYRSLDQERLEAAHAGVLVPRES